MKTERCNSIDEWLMLNDEFRFAEENLFIERLRDKNLTDDQILDVLHVIDNTCMLCLDGDNGCQCWNDE